MWRDKESFDNTNPCARSALINHISVNGYPAERSRGEAAFTFRHASKKASRSSTSNVSMIVATRHRLVLGATARLSANFPILLQSNNQGVQIVCILLPTRIHPAEIVGDFRDKLTKPSFQCQASFKKPQVGAGLLLVDVPGDVIVQAVIHLLDLTLDTG